MTPTPDTLVLGMGTMGSAVLWCLGRAGRSAVGFDQFNPPHSLGEHAGEQRMFRMSYYEHPDYVPLLKRSLDAWRELPVPGGEPDHFHVTGALYVGPESGEVVPGATTAARRHHLAHETLSRADVRSRFPEVSIPAGWCGLAERDAGFIVPELAVARMLRHSGRTARVNEKIIGWSASSGRCVVGTSRGGAKSSSLVVTPGPWASTLLADLGVTLSVTRQVQVWVRPRRPEQFAQGKFPCWAVELPSGGLLYGFPIPPGRDEMKVALHRPGKVVDPDRVDRETRIADAAPVLAELERYLPAAAGPVTRMSVCLYTNTPDSHFIIDRHPKYPNVIVACGFSGHGFKFAPVVGEIVEVLLRSPTEPHPAPFLSLERFGNPR